MASRRCQPMGSSQAVKASMRTLAGWHQGVACRPPGHVEAATAHLALQGCPPRACFPHAAPPSGARPVQGVTITTPGARLGWTCSRWWRTAEVSKGQAAWRPRPSPSLLERGQHSWDGPDSHPLTQGSFLPTPGWVKTRSRTLRPATSESQEVKRNQAGCTEGQEESSYHEPWADCRATGGHRPAPASVGCAEPSIWER